jgi:hypothetical protein
MHVGERQRKSAHCAAGIPFSGSRRVLSGKSNGSQQIHRLASSEATFHNGLPCFRPDAEAIHADATQQDVADGCLRLTEERMPKKELKPKTLAVAAALTLGVLALCVRAEAQGTAPPNLNGGYRCQPNPTPCFWPGQTPSISQSGTKLDIKNDKGDTSAARLTSDITISAGAPFNSLGIIRADHSIDWSNGTTWHKQ